MLVTLIRSLLIKGNRDRPNPDTATTLGYPSPTHLQVFNKYKDRNPKSSQKPAQPRWERENITLHLKILLVFSISFISETHQYVHLRCCYVYISAPNCGSIRGWLNLWMQDPWIWMVDCTMPFSMRGLSIPDFSIHEGPGTNLPQILRDNCMAFYILYLQIQIWPPKILSWN